MSIGYKPLIAREKVPCTFRNASSGATTFGLVNISANGVVSNAIAISGYNEIDLQINYFGTR